MIVMTTGLSGLVALMQREDRPVARPMDTAAVPPPALASITVTARRMPR